MDTSGYNSFSSGIGVVSSLMSIACLVTALRYRGHLPEARLIDLQRLLDDVDRICERDYHYVGLSVPHSIQHRLKCVYEAAHECRRDSARAIGVWAQYRAWFNGLSGRISDVMDEIKAVRRDLLLLISAPARPRWISSAVVSEQLQDSLPLHLPIERHAETAIPSHGLDQANEPLTLHHIHLMTYPDPLSMPLGPLLVSFDELIARFDAPTSCSAEGTSALKIALTVPSIDAMGLDHICEGFDIKFMASRNANAPNVVLNDMSLETALWQNGVLVSQITNELVEDEVRPTLAGSTGSQRRVAVATSIRGTNSLKSCVLTSPGSTKEVQILQTLCIKAQPICFIVYDVEQGLTPAAALVGLKRCGPLDLSSLLTSRDWRLHTATSSSPPVPGDAYPWFADPGAVECASAPDGDVHARPSCPHVNDGDLGRRKNENGSSVTRQPNPASAPSPVTSEPLRSGADEDLPTSEWNEDTQARPARIHISDAGLRRRVSWATWQSHPDFPPSPAQLGSSLPKAHYPLVSAGAPFDRDRLLEFDVETEEYEQLLGPRSPLLNFTDTINQQFVQGLEEGSSRRTTVVGSWESREPDPPVLPSPAEPCRIPLPPSP